MGRGAAAVRLRSIDAPGEFLALVRFGALRCEFNVVTNCNSVVNSAPQQQLRLA